MKTKTMIAMLAVLAAVFVFVAAPAADAAAYQEGDAIEAEYIATDLYTYIDVSIADEDISTPPSVKWALTVEDSMGEVILGGLTSTTLDGKSAAFMLDAALAEGTYTAYMVYAGMQSSDAEFEVGGADTYTLVATADGAEVAVDPEMPEAGYEPGTEITITFTPIEGYYFEEFTVNGEAAELDDNNSYTFEILEDTVAYALFVEEPVVKHTVTVAADPADAGTVTGAGVYAEGATATVTAVAAEGYVFVNWTVDGEEISDDAEFEFPVLADIALVANFEPETPVEKFEVVLYVYPEDAGTVTGAGEYNDGEIVTVTATAAEGYVFVNWTVLGLEISDEETYSFVIEADSALVANFVAYVPEYVAFIGDVGYESFEAALEAAVEGDTIYTLVNAELADDVAGVNIELAEQGLYVSLAPGVTYTGTISYDDDAVAVNGFSASNTTTFTAGSIIVKGATDGAEFTATEGTVIFDDFKIADDAVLTIGEDAAVIVQGTVTGGTIQNDGEIYVSSEDQIKSDVEGNPVIVATMKVKFTKLAGVEYSVNGEVVTTTTATIEVGDLITVKILFGYEANEKFAVKFDGEAQDPVFEGTYAATLGLTTVKVEGVSQIDYRNTTVSGTTQDAEFGIYDMVTVSGEWIISEDSNVIINGGLIVPEGATVIVSQNARLIIGGQVDLDGTLYIMAADSEDDAPGYMEILPAGQISEYYVIADPQVNVDGKLDDGGIMVVGGDLNINSEAVIGAEGIIYANGDVIVNKDAKMTINGSVESDAVLPGLLAAITVYGQLEYDSEIPSAAVTTILVKSGAQVDVKKFTVEVAGMLMIVDDGKNIIELVAEAHVSEKSVIKDAPGTILACISGAVVKATSVTKDDVTTYTLDVAGTIVVDSVYIEADSEDAPTLEAKGGIIMAGADKNGIVVSGSLVASENVVVGNAGVLKVTGTIDTKATKNAEGFVTTATEMEGYSSVITVSGSGIISVYGDKGISGTGVVNATRYVEKESSTVSYTNYVTVDAALAMVAAGSDIKSYTVLGTQTVSASATITEGYEFDISGAKLVISDKATLSIENTSKVALKGNGSSVVDVKGTLFAADKTDISNAVRETGIKADVISMELNSKGEEVKKGWQKWTNISTALAEAQDGEVIKLAQDVKSSKDITIPEKVTVDAGEYDITMAEMKKLTVNGTLVLGDGSEVILKGTGDRKAILEVNGILKSTDIEDLYAKYGLAAAYYDLTDDVDTYHCVSPVAYVAPIAATVDQDKDGHPVIDIKGDKLVVGDVTFKGVKETDYDDAIIPLISVLVEDYTATNMTVDEAMIYIAPGVKFTGKVSGAEGAFDLKVMGALLGATVDAITDDDGLYLTISGAVTYYNAEKLAFSLKTSGTTYIQDLAAVSADLAGKVGIENSVINDVVVEGEVIVVNEARLIAETITVKDNGSLTAAAKTDKLSQGSIEADNIFMGTTATDVFIGASAVLSGDVKLGDYLIMVPTATIPDYFENADNYKSTVFYVEKETYLIAIVPVGTDATADIGDVAAKVDNAIFNNWESLLGADLTDVALGDAAAAFADFDYDIYAVMIKTDAGIKSVSLNGIVMVSPASGENIFRLADLKAGTYKVTYTLVDGYEGTAVLTTEMGTVMPNNSFTLSGTDLDDLVVLYQLSGTAPIPEPEPTPTPEPEKESEWNVTTILLLVLVILIAIMAVIVALRLNRN